MQTERGAGVIEFGIENIFAMAARSNPIIDDEGQDDLARSFSAVGNIFAPTRAPASVTADSVARGAAIVSVVAQLTADLFCAR